MSDAPAVKQHMQCKISVAALCISYSNRSFIVSKAGSSHAAPAVAAAVKHRLSAMHVTHSSVSCYWCR